MRTWGGVLLGCACGLALLGCDRLYEVSQGGCLGECLWRLHTEFDFPKRKEVGFSDKHPLYSDRQACLAVIYAWVPEFLQQPGESLVATAISRVTNGVRIRVSHPDGPGHVTRSCRRVPTAAGSECSALEGDTPQVQ
jgi:hypothetical protein